MKLKILAIADIHWGAMNSEILYNNLSLVLDTIKNNSIDLVVVLGDYFDYKLALNSKQALFAIHWMDELINTCKASNVKKIRILKGTHEHDNNQLEVFSKYDNGDGYFRLFNVNTIEETLPGLKCLYASDENIYTKDYHTIYKDNLNSFLDVGFFHGNFDFAMPSMICEKYLNNEICNILFQYDIFSKIIRGPLVAGHWHVSMQHDRALYCGSFDRWKYGEEDPKGFYIIDYDTDDYSYSLNFIENKNARIYKELSYNLSVDTESSFYTNIIEEVANKYNLTDEHIKLVFYNYSNDLSVSEYIDSIRRHFINIPNVKIVEKTDKISKQKKEEIKSKEIDLKQEYAFIFDKSLSISEKIQNYIFLKKGKSIPVDIIDKFISPYIDIK